MSDLISRSELILHISDYALQVSPNVNESTVQQTLSQMIYDAILNCISCVEEQPTAYDVDKVAEQLEDYLFDKYCIEGDSNISEIVKQGGRKE